MYIALLVHFFSLFILLGGGTKGHAAGASEIICGEWKTTENNLMVEVYKEDNTYKAKIIWFNDGDDPSLMGTWTDHHNPDPALRTGKY